MWAVDSKWDQKEVSFLFVCADGTLHSWWIFLKPAGHRGAGGRQKDSKPGLEAGVEDGNARTNNFTDSEMPARDHILSLVPHLLIIRDLLYNLEGMFKKA